LERLPNGEAAKLHFEGIFTLVISKALKNCPIVFGFITELTIIGLYYINGIGSDLSILL